MKWRPEPNWQPCASFRVAIKDVQSRAKKSKKLQKSVSTPDKKSWDYTWFWKSTLVQGAQSQWVTSGHKRNHPKCTLKMPIFTVLLLQVGARWPNPKWLKSCARVWPFIQGWPEADHSTVSTNMLRLKLFYHPFGKGWPGHTTEKLRPVSESPWLGLSRVQIWTSWHHVFMVKTERVQKFIMETAKFQRSGNQVFQAQ